MIKIFEVLLSYYFAIIQKKSNCRKDSKMSDLIEGYLGKTVEGKSRLKT